MKAWWSSLGLHERRLVIGGAVAMALFLLYVAVWAPLQSTRSRLQQQADAQRETLQWMQASAAEIRQLSARTAGRRPASGQSLLGLIDQSAREQRLADAVKRVQPDGTNNVRVWLEGAAFDDLMRWLGTLEQRHGVAIEALNIDRGEQEGRVAARLTLTSPP